MNFILNVLLLVVCLTWFYQRIKTEPRAPLIPVILTFLLGGITVFGISLLISNEYLVFIEYLIVFSIAIGTFWLAATFYILRFNLKKGTPNKIFSEVIQVSMILVLPVIAFFTIHGSSLKIGG